MEINREEEENSEINDPLTQKIIGLAIEIHNYLGPGLLESSYVQCLSHELALNQLSFKLETPVPVLYKNIKLNCGYRIDLLIEDRLIVEIKSVYHLLRIHEAQLLTYMKFANASVGLLINFNVLFLKNGLRRLTL
jgi:GxxExxY protein